MEKERRERDRKERKKERLRRQPVGKERRRETEERNEVIQPIFQPFHSPNIWIRGAIYATLKYITSYITILFNIRIFCYYRIAEAGVCKLLCMPLNLRITRKQNIY